MFTFTKIYFALGLGALALFALADVRGALLRPFGPTGDVDTSSRQGQWYTYKPYVSSSGSSSPGRSPGSRGGSSGGWSGGK